MSDLGTLEMNHIIISIELMGHVFHVSSHFSNLADK